MRDSCKNIQVTETSRVGLEITWTAVCVLEMSLDFLTMNQSLKTLAFPGFHLCDVVTFAFGCSVWQLLSMSLCKQVS